MDDGNGTGKVNLLLTYNISSQVPASISKDP